MLKGTFLTTISEIYPSPKRGHPRGKCHGIIGHHSAYCTIGEKHYDMFKSQKPGQSAHQHRLIITSVFLRNLKWFILGSDLCAVWSDFLLSANAMGTFSPVMF